MPTESNAGERPAAMSECNECNEALAEARRVIAEQRRLAMIAEQAIVKRDLTGARSTLRALMTQSLHRTPARNPVVPLRGIQHGFGFTGKVLNHLPGPLPSAVPFTAPSAAVTRVVRSCCDCCRQLSCLRATRRRDRRMLGVQWHRRARRRVHDRLSDASDRDGPERCRSDRRRKLFQLRRPQRRDR